MPLTANAWLVSIALGHLVLEVCNNCLPVIYPSWVSAGMLSYAQIGVLTLAVSAIESFLRPLMGFLSHQWHAGRVVVLSIALCGLCMGGVGLVHTRMALFGLIVMAVVGSAAFHPVGATLSSARPASSRGLAFSLFSVAGSLGSAISPLLITAGSGWLARRSTLVLIPLALVSSALLYPRLGRRARVADLGIAQPPDPLAVWAPVLIVPLIVVVMMRNLGHVSFVTYLPALVQSQQGTVQWGSQLLFAYLLATAIGSVAGGAASDWFGRPSVIALFVALLLPLTWFFPDVSGGLALALALATGLMHGATMTVSIVLAQEIWSRRPASAAGLMMGLPAGAAGLGALVTGTLADHFSLELALRALVAPASVCAAAIACYLLMARHRALAADRNVRGRGRRVLSDRPGSS